MQAAHDLAIIIDDHKQAELLSKRLKIIRPACQQFWDEQRQCFGDNLDKKTHSLQANTWAIRAQICTGEQLQAVRTHLRHELQHIFVNGYNNDLGCRMSPAFSFYVFDGLYQAGLADLAEKTYREAWGWLLAQGCKTVPEFFGLSNSLCHAWSASPTYYLSRYMVGIHFSAPDFNTVTLDAQCGDDIAYAHSIFPHPKGQIEVKWTRDHNGTRHYDIINVPAGMTVNIIA